jgi:heterodisulfide reductase subunit A
MRASEPSPRTGVMFCSCHGEISGGLEMEELRAYTRGLPDVVFVGETAVLCDKKGQDELHKIILDNKLDRVVVAGCTPRVYEDTVGRALVAAGLNRYMLEMANLREQCVWPHRDKKRATEKAKLMLAAAVGRASLLEPLHGGRLGMKRAALVIGGGVAGMQAAIDIADAGNDVVLVEASGKLGGRTYQLSTTFPTHECKPDGCCIHYCRECILTPKIEDVMQHPRIKVLVDSKLEEFGGVFGNYHAKIKGSEGVLDIEAGTVVVATGSKTIDPTKLPEFGYGRFKDVITFLELEEMIVAARSSDNQLHRPSDGKIPSTIDFIQCVGSRDTTGRGKAHCSLVCCTYAIGQAKELKKRYPDAQIFIHYIDLRGPYRGFEEHYREARDVGIQFLRGRVAEVTTEKGELVVVGEDIDTGKLLRIRSDLVVLAVGQEAAEGTEQLSTLFHIPLDTDGFLREYNPAFDMLRRKGIAVAGCAAGPKGIRYSVQDAKAAAAALNELMRSGEVTVPAVKAEVDEARCSGCRQCEKLCPAGAISMRQLADFRRGTRRWVAYVTPSQCASCGACAMGCPSKAILLSNYKMKQLLAQIEALT